MKKELLIIVSGEIEKLMQVWKLPEEIESEVKDYGDGDIELELLFSEGQLGLVDGIKSKLDGFRESFNLKTVSMYSSFDFTTEDLQACELLGWQGESNYELELRGVDPLQEERCSGCGAVSSKIVEMDELHYFAHGELKHKVIFAGTLILLEQSILTEIREQGWGESLKSMPCRIEFENGEINRDYSFIYSSCELGPIAGAVEYGESCKECGTPEVIDNRNFVGAVYKREHWQGEDFCSASVIGAETLYVSQRVYQYLDSLPHEVKGNINFVPVELV